VFRSARSALTVALVATGLVLAPAAEAGGLRGKVVSTTTTTSSAGTSPAPKRAVAAQDGVCRNADLQPSAQDQDAVRAAVLCLLNRERTRRGLGELRQHPRLHAAALAHSADMAARDFFEHTTPGGSSMVDRILGARYVRRSEGWSLGENLAWGTGTLSTPDKIVKAWMQSAGHRANVLRGAFREIGIGVVPNLPFRSTRPGATYTTDFGLRR